MHALPPQKGRRVEAGRVKKGYTGVNENMQVAAPWGGGAILFGK